MSSWHEPNPDPLGNTRLHFAVAGLALAGLVAGLAATAGWESATYHPPTCYRVTVDDLPAQLARRIGILGSGIDWDAPAQALATNGARVWPVANGAHCGERINEDEIYWLVEGVK